MTDTHRAVETENAEELARARREALRRFHFGDRDVAVERPGADVLPAALAALRGSAVRGGFPLVVDPEGTDGALARPLEAWLAAADAPRTFADNLPRLLLRASEALAGAEPPPARSATSAGAERVAEELGLAGAARDQYLAEVRDRLELLPPRARLVPFGRRAPLALASLAATRRVEAARGAFAAEAESLALTAGALLEVDRERRPEGVAAPERVERLGALGARFVDPSRLAGVLGQRRAGAPLEEARRARLEAARAELVAFDTHRHGPLWLVPAREEGVDLMAAARLAADPCGAAAAAFDEASEAVARLVRAARLVRLEAAAALDLERHLPWLERLDWRAFAREELALVRPVLALVHVEDLLAGGLTSLSRLLLSGRPVQVVLLLSESGTDASAFRFEPAYFGVGHREAFVQQGSLARPLALAAGFERALAGGRPALHVVDAPPAEGASLDPWLVASARVSGRAAPIFRYDPEAGTTWARRLAFDENPEPAADWPREPLPDGGSAPFTFADAALVDPAWREHFALADGPGASSRPEPRSDQRDHFARAGDEEELAPFAEWLELADEESARRLPYVLGVGADGSSARWVVDRVLAFATRDRLGFWRTLEELAGVRNEHVDAAVARAREEERERAERERRERAAAHERELEQVRSRADQEAVDRLVTAIFELEGGAPLPGAERPRPPAVEAATAPATAAAPAAAAAPSEAAAAPPPPAVAEEEEAWVDTALCTSCDECTRKLPQVFAYNGNKQAYVKNARGAPYRDIVATAELCTAKIIHPGTPWDPAEPGLAATIERARALAAR